MKNKLILIIFISLLCVNLISAINLDITAKEVSNIVVADLNEPAVFDLTIRNLGFTSDFEVYSLVGVDIYPETTFQILSGETKKITIEAMPQESLQSQTGPFTFEYRIKNSEGEIQKESLTINIADLSGAILITPDNLNLKSEKLSATVKNKANVDFDDLEIKMNSVFIDFETSLPLKAKETAELEIPIDTEKLKTLDEGPYLLNIVIKTQGKTKNTESIIKVLGEENIEKTEIKEGVIINKHEIIYHNLGNIRKTIEIGAKKNLFSYLFTTVNIAPTKTETRGFTKYYFWEKELIPNEEFKITIKTNWFYPIIVILLAIFLFVLIKRSAETDLILRKKVSFVRTKGGQFALKITLKTKAKKFIERINVIDKLPPLVKLYERYGAIAPDKVDLDNRRLEWNLESLAKDEERIFTYIIYSKIGVVGRFELPSAKAVYEKEGKIKRTESNRSFFINEPKKNK